MEFIFDMGQDRSLTFYRFFGKVRWKSKRLEPVKAACPYWGNNSSPVKLMSKVTDQDNLIVSKLKLKSFAGVSIAVSSLIPAAFSFHSWHNEDRWFADVHHEILVIKILVKYNLIPIFVYLVLIYIYIYTIFSRWSFLIKLKYLKLVIYSSEIEVGRKFVHKVVHKMITYL